MWTRLTLRRRVENLRVRFSGLAAGTAAQIGHVLALKHPARICQQVHLAHGEHPAVPPGRQAEDQANENR